MREAFAKGQLAKILDLDSRLLDKWIQRGYLYPSILQADGSGYRHVFSRDDLYALRLFMRLNALKFDRAEAAELSDSDKSTPSWATVGTDTHFVFARRVNDKGMMETKGFMGKLCQHELPDPAEWEYVVNVNVGKLKAEIDAKA